MISSRALFWLFPVLGVCLLVVVRATAVSEIRLESPSAPLPGAEVRLSIAARTADRASYRWTATSGYFQGPTDRSSVVFVMPATGSAFVSCVEEVGGAQRTYNRVLSLQPASASATRQLPPAVPAETTPYDIGRGGFVPSGWMGDQKGLASETSTDGPPDARGSRRWTWTPAKSGPGWVAVAYQYPDKNWGDKPGRDLSGAGYRELSVWARGVADRAGRFPVVQFKSGGATDPAKKIHASFEAEGDFVELSRDWKRYTVSIAGKNLSQVISAFTFVLRADDQPRGAEIFLAQIELR